MQQINCKEKFGKQNQEVVECVVVAACGVATMGNLAIVSGSIEKSDLVTVDL